MLIKSSRAHSARHEFISHSYSLPCHHHRQEETRTLIRDSLSLSLCVHSLSLCVLVLLLFVFTFHPQKWALDTKINSSLLSLSYGRKYTLIIGSNCYRLNQRTPRVLHMLMNSAFCHHRRVVVSSSSTRERERERERERKRRRKRRARRNDGRKFCIYKIRETGKKTRCRCHCFSAATRKRERGSDTRI